MNLQAVFGALGNVFGELIAVAIGIGLGWIWGNWRAITAWRRKEFLSQVVLSLNMIFFPEKEGEATKLRLRTLFEGSLEEVFPNLAQRKMVQDAISNTTEEDPLLRFDKDDAWYMLNNILNKIAENYSMGYLKRDAGEEVTSRMYLFCLTFERAGEMRAMKPRIMIMDKEKFLKFPEGDTIDVVTPMHKKRIETLRILKKEYKLNPHLFMEMEIVM